MSNTCTSQIHELFSKRQTMEQKEPFPLRDKTHQSPWSDWIWRKEIQFRIGSQRQRWWRNSCRSHNCLGLENSSHWKFHRTLWVAYFSYFHRWKAVQSANENITGIKLMNWLDFLQVNILIVLWILLKRSEEIIHGKSRGTRS